MSDNEDDRYAMQAFLWVRPDAVPEIEELLEWLSELSDREMSLYDEKQRLTERARDISTFAPDKRFAADLMECLPSSQTNIHHTGFVVEKHTPQDEAEQRAYVEWNGGYVDENLLAGVMQFLLRRYRFKDQFACVLHEKATSEGVGHSMVIEHDRKTTYDSEKLAHEHRAALTASPALVDTEQFLIGLDRLVEAQASAGRDQELAALRALVREQARLMNPGQRHALLKTGTGVQLLLEAAAQLGPIGLLPGIENAVLPAEPAPGMQP